MRLLACLALAAAAAAVAAAADEAVLDLTAANFDETIEKNPLIMVEFFAPWCGHCKALAPEYEKAAQELQAAGLPLAKVDADQEANRPLAQRFGVRGFPTVKLFRNGQPTDYEGERRAAAIVSFMKKQALPAVSALADAAAVEKFSGEDRVVAVGFFATAEQQGEFDKVAQKLRDKFLFGAVTGAGAAALAAQFGGAGVAPPAVVLFKTFDERKNVLSGANLATDLEPFVLRNSVPLIDEIGPQNYRQYMESGLPLAYVFVDLTVSGQREQFIDVVRSVAEKARGQVNFVYIDWAKYAKHSERLGLSGKTVPALAIEHEGRHWAYDEQATIDTAAVQKWIDSFLDKSLPATIKSEDVPASNDGDVTVVVAKSFDDIVLKSGKNVLVEFYAPWCGHCKHLAPIYEELGKHFQTTDSVVIAKIDATANDVDPKYGIRGFPTLKLFRADGEVVDYQGDRSLEDLKKFVADNSAKAAVGGGGKDEL